MKFNFPEHWYKYLAFTVGVFLILYNSVYLPSEHRGNWGQSDFGVYYSAGQIVLNDVEDVEPMDIYNREVFRRIIKTNRKPAGGTLFLYPPSAAVIFAPLALIDYSPSFQLWRFFNIGFFIATFYLIIRYFLQDAAWFKLRYTLLLFVLSFSSPLVDTLRTGQLNTVIFFALVLGFIALGKKMPNISSACISIATAIKLFPGIFLPYLALKRDWKRLGTLLLWLGAAFILSLPFFGFDGIYYFVTEIFPELSAGIAWGDGGGSTLFGAVFLAQTRGVFDFLPWDPEMVLRNSKAIISGVGVVVFALICFVINKYHKQESGLNQLIDYSLLTTFVLLFSISTHRSYHLLLLPLIMYLLGMPIKKQNSIFLLIGAIALLLTHFYEFLPLSAPDAWLIFRPTTIGIIIVFLVALLGRRVLANRIVFSKES